MKIVANKCFGGFGISNLALRRLIDKGSELVEAFTPKSYYGGDNPKYRKQNEWKESWERDFPSRFNKEDGDWWSHGTYDMWYNEKEDKIYTMVSRYEDENIRTHIDLVELVEDLGVKASSSLAQLEVIEIPDDVEWEIDDYDGIETIREKHRSW